MVARIFLVVHTQVICAKQACCTQTRSHRVHTVVHFDNVGDRRAWRTYSAIKSRFFQTHRTSQKHSGQVHSALATLLITARQAMRGGHQQTRQRKQGMFISGHAQASPEAASARPSKHAYRGTIQQEVPPDQSHAELPQSTSHKRGPQDTSRARGLIP
jgi:hypothetical protein